MKRRKIGLWAMVVLLVGVTTGAVTHEINVGSKADIEDVKTAINEKLPLAYGLANYYASLNDSAALANDETLIEKRRTELSHIWVKEEVENNLEIETRAMRELSSSPLSKLNRARIVISDWRDVEVVGDSASAVFTGHLVMFNDTDSVAEQEGEFQVSLKRNPISNVWLLSKSKIISHPSGA